MTTERIHPAPDVRKVNFQTYQRAIVMMHAEGLYDQATGWLPAARERIKELLERGPAPAERTPPPPNDGAKHHQDQPIPPKRY
jgi:hypothetical protein